MISLWKCNIVYKGINKLNIIQTILKATKTSSASEAQQGYHSGADEKPC